MKKFLKWLLGIAAVSSAVGLLIAYFCRKSEIEESDEKGNEKGEGFEADNEAKPGKDREYVPLKRGKGQDEKNKTDNEVKETQDMQAKDQCEEKKTEEKTKTNV